MKLRIFSAIAFLLLCVALRAQSTTSTWEFDGGKDLQFAQVSITPQDHFTPGTPTGHSCHVEYVAKNGGIFLDSADGKYFWVGHGTPGIEGYQTNGVCTLDYGKSYVKHFEGKLLLHLAITFIARPGRLHVFTSYTNSKGNSPWKDEGIWISKGTQE
jgi:hypothetical protein